MRLDKFLVMMEVGSRSQVKSYIKKGMVSVNGVLCRNPEQHLNERQDSVIYNGKLLKYSEFRYYMLHKPAGVITATEDGREQTVMDLLDEAVLKKDLFPVGRLDKDTEGLLLLTNDGVLAHFLLSPKCHVDKTYLVHTRNPIREADVFSLSQGVDIGEAKKTMPAKVRVLDESRLLLTIQEGRFHQVKRMLQAVGNEVVYLKRISFGALTLDKDLEPGKYRELTAEEVERVKGVLN